MADPANTGVTFVNTDGILNIQSSNAIWVNANLGAIIPKPITDTLALAQPMLQIAQTALGTVQEGLGFVQKLLALLKVGSNLVAEILTNMRDDLLRSGVYMLPLWDYPVRQLMATDDYSPQKTYGLLNFGGTTFAAFADDIARAFHAKKDANRPFFKGSCAMLIIVAAYPEISGLAINTEDSLSRIFSQLGTQGLDAGILRARWQGSWAKMRAAVDKSPPDLIEKRTVAYFDGFEMYQDLDEDNMMEIPIPGEDIGDPFFEHTDPSKIPYSSIDLTLKNIAEFDEAPEYPNWTRRAVVDVLPPLADCIYAVFDPLIALFTQSSGLVAQLQALLDIVAAKLQALKDIVDKINDTLVQIEALISLTGFYALYVSSSTGTEGLISEMSASKHPFVDSLGHPTKQFFSGVALVAGGVDVMIDPSAPTSFPIPIFPLIFGAIGGAK